MLAEQRDQPLQSEQIAFRTEPFYTPHYHSRKKALSPKGLTRRDALRLACAPLVALGAGRFAQAEEAAPGFTFIAVNDLHFSDAECAPFFRNVVARMKASAPEAAFCLIAGDLADRGTAAQYAPLREILAGLGVPLHPVPGNHDYLTDRDRDRTAYEAAFPGKLNSTFQHRGWQFVGLDSTQGTDFDGTRVSDDTLTWLDTALPKLDAALPTVAWTHFPLGAGVAMRPLNAGDLLGRLRKLNLRATFSGHWHGLNEQRLDRAELIVNRCCARIRGNRDGSPLKGWWVCQTEPDGVLKRRFVALPAAESGLR